MSIFTYIVGSGTLLLLIFCFHLLITIKANRTLNRLLSISMLSRIGLNIVFLLIDCDQLVNFPYIPIIFTPLTFAAPGCFYLYIFFFINNKTGFKKGHLIHFVPAIFLLVDSVFTLTLSPISLPDAAVSLSSERPFFSMVKIGFFPAKFYYIGRHVLFLIYLIFAWKVVVRSGILKKKGSIERKWLLICLLSTSLFQLIGTFPVIKPLFSSHIPSDTFILVFVSFSCLMFVAFMIFIIHQPAILYGYLIMGPEKNIQDVDLEVSSKSSKDSNPIRLNITTSQTEEYIKAIHEFMENEKPYLDNKFQIINLANHLNIPVHHCSFIINNIIGKNFRDWINSYRIQYFLKIYTTTSSKMTIDGLAFDSGFNSISTFYRAFKKETGKMPMVYFKNDNASFFMSTSDVA